MEAKHVNIYFAALAHLVGATLTIDNFRENWQNIGLAPPSEIYILVKSAVADLGFTKGDHQPQKEGRLVNMNENENENENEIWHRLLDRQPVTSVSSRKKCLDFQRQNLLLTKITS